MSPPMTVTPIGARTSPPWLIATGSMPKIIAAALRRLGVILGGGAGRVLVAGGQRRRL